MDGLILIAAYYPYFRGTLDDARNQRWDAPVPTAGHE